MKNPQRSLYILFVFVITICIFFGGCGAEGDNAYSGEQTELAVERIFDKIQKAYGGDYLPDTDMDTQALQEEFDAEAEKQLLTSLAEAAAAGLTRLPDAQARQRRLQSLQRRWLAHGFPPGDVYEAIRAAAAAVSEEG